jgi:hypothetical protein
VHADCSSVIKGCDVYVLRWGCLQISLICVILKRYSSGKDLALDSVVVFSFALEKLKLASARICFYSSYASYIALLV